jgi:heme-degrading monooxygenase HmoA
MQLKPLAFLTLGFITLFNFLPLNASAQAQPKAPHQQAPNVSTATQKAVIARIWHGRTKTSKADEYYKYLTEAGINKIRQIPGNLEVQVLRRSQGDITEFTVISYWESLDAIRKFAGDDLEKTHNLPRDPEYLLELEPRVKHYEVVLDEKKPLIAPH